MGTQGFKKIIDLVRIKFLGNASFYRPSKNDVAFGVPKGFGPHRADLNIHRKSLQGLIKIKKAFKDKL